MVQKCRLCQQVATLRRSHVIPEFLYKPYYDGKHRFQAFRFGSNPDPAVDLEQKGYREHLLCGACETRLSRYETYAAKAYFQRQRFELGFGFEYRGLDYHNMKLFQLSLLWRVAVSSIPFCTRVSIDSSDTERIRQMLLRDQPGESVAYPCLVTEDPSLTWPFMGAPLQQDRTVTLMVANQVWQFSVTSNAASLKWASTLSKCWLGPDGVLMGFWRDLRETPFWGSLVQHAQGWSSDFLGRYDVC